MAQAPRRRLRARVRKTAPTLRQQIEAAKVEEPQTKKAKSKTSKVATSKRKLANNNAVNGLKKGLRPIKRLLRLITPRYFVNSWREVRQVTWPSRRETWRLTLAVFIFAIIFGALVAVVDKGLDEFFKKVILK